MTKAQMNDKCSSRVVLIKVKAKTKLIKSDRSIYHKLLLQNNHNPGDNHANKAANQILAKWNSI